MRGLTELPEEILLMILLEAVKARGLRRALRLRLVSRHFSVVVRQAIYESLMMDEVGHHIRRDRGRPLGDARDLAYAVANGRSHEEPDHEYERYLTWRLTTGWRPNPKTLILRSMRQVAEAIFAVSSSSAIGKLEDCITGTVAAEIRFLWPLTDSAMLEEGRLPRAYLEKCEDLPEPVDETTLSFTQRLIVTATLLNETELVRDQIEEFGALRAAHSAPYILGPAMKAAAAQGNIGLLEYLTGNYNEMLRSICPHVYCRHRRFFSAIAHTIPAAACCSDANLGLEALKFALEHLRPYMRALTDGEQKTFLEALVRVGAKVTQDPVFFETSLDAIPATGGETWTDQPEWWNFFFDIIPGRFWYFPLGLNGELGLVESAPSSSLRWPLENWLLFRLAAAASHGSPAMLRNLVEGAPGATWMKSVGGGVLGPRDFAGIGPIGCAARKGHYDAVQYLLGADAARDPLDWDDLEQAATGGSLRIMELLWAQRHEVRALGLRKEVEDNRLEWDEHNDSLHAAAHGGRMDIGLYWEERANVRDHCWPWLLLAAVRRENDAVVQFLLHRAADDVDVKVVCSGLRKAEWYAQRDGLDSMVRAVRQHPQWGDDWPPRPPTIRSWRSWRADQIRHGSSERSVAKPAVGESEKAATDEANALGAGNGSAKTPAAPPEAIIIGEANISGPTR